MDKFIVGFLILALIGILWMAWEIKHTPDDGTGDVDYDEYVKDMKEEQDMYLNNKSKDDG